MKEKELSDAQGQELMAHVCFKLDVAVPGPGAGMEVCRVLETLNVAIEKMRGKRAEHALEMYKEALTFVAGVWAYQQKLIIDKLEAGLAGGRQ